jgi:hypothetical protein
VREEKEEDRIDMKSKRKNGVVLRVREGGGYQGKCGNKLGMSKKCFTSPVTV